MEKYILQIEHLTKSFTRKFINSKGLDATERFNIIQDFELYIPKNEITALIGGNGAGKTTLFNIISRFTDADKGEILYHYGEKKIFILKERAYNIARLGIGRMFQDNHIFMQMSVLENMLIADDNTWGEKPFLTILNPRKHKEVEKKRISKAKNIFADLFGVDNPFWKMKDKPASSLSYGQQRLLGLARLLMGNYKLLLLDEPTSGVNAKYVKTICKIIKKMVTEKNLTVILIEHNMKVVQDIADFCCFMSHGKITAFGTPEDVLGNEQVRKTYLGM